MIIIAYHMWAMISTSNYILFSGDTDFLDRNWAGFVRAMGYVYSLVEADGLLKVKQPSAWARYVYSYNGSQPNMM